MAGESALSAGFGEREASLLAVQFTIAPGSIQGFLAVLVKFGLNLPQVTHNSQFYSLLIQYVSPYKGRGQC